jgi:S1-C subfamily serine protease
MKPSREVTGSGFAIGGRRILTNAHVVANATFVTVRKFGSPLKIPARVVALGKTPRLLEKLIDGSRRLWWRRTRLRLGDAGSGRRWLLGRPLSPPAR